MSDVLLPLSPQDEIRRLQLQISIDDIHKIDDKKGRKAKKTIRKDINETIKTIIN